jgi:hypothetical protein
MGNLDNTLTLKKPDAMPPQRSGEVCSVACKLPHGIELWLYQDAGENKFGEKVMERRAGPVILNGTNAAAKGGKVIGGFGLTDGVDAEFMDAWLAANPEFPAVKNGLIFIGKREKIRAEAKEKKDLQGIETIDPEHPERHNGPDRLAGAKPEKYEGMPPQKDE